MSILKIIFREFSLMLAFVVIGTLLLTTYWITNNLDKSLAEQFKHSQISIVLKSASQDDLRQMLEKDTNVIRYEMQSPVTNRAELSRLYPELSQVMGSLEDRFFPSSATVTVDDPDVFLARIATAPNLVKAHLLHQPPENLQRFFSVLTAVFSVLWIMTLVLVLYFQLERLTYMEQQRWSLMKMLGAPGHKIFIPIWLGQFLRISAASAVAIVAAILATGEFSNLFAWQWNSLNFATWGSFLVISMFMATLVHFVLFSLRYRQVTLG